MFSNINILLCENFYTIMGSSSNIELYTKITTIAYLLITVTILFGFISKTYKLLENKKSKQFYFYTYILVFFLLVTQTLFLLNCPLAQHQDKAILVLFIYTTALMILFLIFLALTSSETYQDLKKNAYENSVIFNNSLSSHLYLYFIFICFIKIFIVDWSFSIFLNIHDTLAFRDILTLQNSYRQNNNNMQILQFNNLNKINREILYGKSTDEISELVQKYANIIAINRQSALFTYTPGPNTNNIFSVLRLEITQNYLEYLLSGILQVLGLVFIICSLII